MHPAFLTSRSGIRQIPIRSAAALLLVLIAADLVDNSCDPSRFLAGSLITSSSGATSGEACGAVCVPDCFCCSTPGPALQAFSIPTTESIVAGPAPPVYNLIAGIPSLLDHVPIAAL